MFLIDKFGEKGDFLMKYEVPELKIDLFLVNDVMTASVEVDNDVSDPWD